MTVEGSTPDEALANLRDEFQRRLAAGAQLMSLHFPSTGQPLAQFAGTLDGTDPLVQAWKESMAEYRAMVEADPDYR